MSILSALIAGFWSVFRSRAAVELEIFALRHQLNVLKRSVQHRPKLTPADRLLWVVFSRVWDDWRSALAIVGGGGHAYLLACPAPFAKEVARAEKRDHGFLAVVGEDSDLQWPTLLLRGAVGVG
jgi:hypothetical protein